MICKLRCSLFSLILMNAPFDLFASQNIHMADFQLAWSSFLNNKEVDFHQIGSETYRDYEFSLLEKFSEEQIMRSRPFDHLMDRYNDICPYIENKITLSDGTEMSASSVQLESDSFIASQAPFQHNVHLFWKMIEENQIDQIVMLTELFEAPRELAYAYWPMKKGEKFSLESGLEITLIDEYELLAHLSEFLQIRKFHLHTSNRDRDVIHYWFRHWPDGQVPTEVHTLLTLLNLVEKDKKECQFISPLLVHCSGGVGRAGVFMTLYHLKQKITRGDSVSLFEIVASLRWQRPYAVCELNQYQFCYELQKHFQDNPTSIHEPILLK